MYKNICIVCTHTFDWRNQVDVYARIHTYAYICYTWLACKTDISDEVRNHRSDVISSLFVVPRPHALIFDHSFHCICATCNNQNGHKSRCSELISGTKALQFVTFRKFLSLTENAGEHRSKDTDHIYGVENWWSEWSHTKIFHSRNYFQRVIGHYTMLACKTDISEEVRSHQSKVISRLFVVPRPPTD